MVRNGSVVMRNRRMGRPARKGRLAGRSLALERAPTLEEPCLRGGTRRRMNRSQSSSSMTWAW
jgi:hypothetical protein